MNPVDVIRSQKATRIVTIAVVVALAAGCGSSPMLAPSGTTLTISSTASALSFSGSATITAQLLDAKGLPQDGAMVTFATTLGSVQPAQVATVGGIATAVFNAGAASGTAVITATSGGALSTGGVKIAVGVAAVAKVVVAANPPTVPFGGGATTITATVVDSTGNPLSTIPVNFASTAGNLTLSSAKTDVKGVVQVTLSTSDPAVVTATASPSSSDAGSGAVTQTSGTVGVSVAPRPQPVVTVAASANPVAQTPTIFTIAATAAMGSNAIIQNVSVNFGDGARADLGAVSGTAIVAQHVYASGGTYTVSVTAVDSAGATTTASTVVVVGFSAPLSVAVAAGPIVPAGASSIVTLTATVTPATAVISRYQWDFGDGSELQIATSNLIQHLYKNGTGPYTVTVKATPAGGGAIASGFTIIFVPAVGP